MTKRLYPLSIQISSLFLILVTLIGAALIAISYQHSQQLLTTSAKEISHENSRKLEAAFRQSASPILATLDFMAFSDFIDKERHANDEARWLGSLKLVFERNEDLVALYFGNDDGDFTMIRPLLTPEARERFEAPPEASLFINQTKVDGTNNIYFLNSEFELIDQRQMRNNEYDPRQRPWYQSAQNDGAIRLTEPYFFYFLKTHGVTLSRRSVDGKKVVAADFTLDSLSNQIARIGYSANTKLALFDHQFRLLAEHNTAMAVGDDAPNTKTKLASGIFASVANRISSQTLYETTDFEGEDWSITLTPVTLNNHVHLLLAEATPQNDLLASLLSMRDKQVAVAIALLAICFVLVWLVATRLASPLTNLVIQTDNIARFDFKKTRYPKSVIKEVADLTQSIELMEHTLHDLLRLLRDTASNQQFDVLAKTITHQSYLVTRAETILLYTYSNEKQQFATVANHAIIPFKIDLNDLVQDTPWLLAELRKGEIVHLTRDDNILRKHKDQLYNSDIYLFPLLNRAKQLVGVLNLGYERTTTKAQLDKHAFLREVLSFAEIAKDNIDKMQQQKDMLNAFIALIASAIDTKSPYTGGHCQRVPELTKMLTEAAAKDNHYFPHFKMSSEQWEELMLAAWMHDCGKVTTPEYVVDKATKLETIYDRIHEIRMRFELLKLQAESDYWQALASGGDDNALKAELDATQATLDEEFAFVANCNIGGEFMSDEDIERLSQIAQRQWKRTLDDQLGISWLESERCDEKAELPVMEHLLADKAVHCVPWEAGKRPQDAWLEEFILKPGALQHNRGELYNLSIRRGTLTEEERFIINDHIVQTIVMLQRLPYPEHLKNVPDIAGGHHERMDGKGYPRGLHEDELSIPARVMAIADVFEALTSNDRPYKKAKTLSESINIMTSMATSGHIDPKLYVLFLEKGIHLAYAERFLDDEQRNEVDIAEHIKRVKAYMKAQF
ncbi:HD domain-containing phosphohydrolase [Vibrio furnissii]|uniref:HD domain-containing phosphohydrolase n=1 Tax=Vibrio furnissii TaxID=29494 RepID=UPI0025728A07|nr:HD domain-containing phosphohydrolase [Vibrio furnissii]WJG28568.1 HD domain-containing phosphohydrolase [Vibrio furnissii]